MRKRIFHWQGQRFVFLHVEGEPRRVLARQASELFERAGQELAALGLSLEGNVVRTRMFGRTREARTAASDARTAALKGRARASGSSYISPAHFSSGADVGIDLLAMAAPAGGAAREVTEHAPVQPFIRHLVWGPMVFLAGMTCERYPALKEQYEDILPRAGQLLEETGCTWKNVVRVSFFLQRDEDPNALLAGITSVAPLPLENAEIEFVDGFSRPGKLVEIEVTARRNGASKRLQETEFARETSAPPLAAGESLIERSGAR
jgi:enamine deaminase RidA (YjgF/YER057c/UK114 family)